MQVVPSLPSAPRAWREALLARPARPEEHARALEALPALHAVEAAPAPGAAAVGSSEPPAAVRVVAWNAERGHHPEAAAALLRRSGAAAVLLSELDLGMARTGQRHTARDLADALGFARVFGAEFLELGLGDARESAACAGQQNELGYHGNAVLAALPLARPALARLETRGAWFGPERGQRRVGGRMAVLATLRLAGGDVALASVHLESHSDADDRAAQLGALLDALDAYAPGAPALVGGDLNTLSLGIADLADRERVRRALAADPERWGHPVPHEPLFELAASRGFDWQRCNLRGVSTHRVAGGEAAPSARGALKLDWFLARGLATREPAVLPAADPATGRALSDHEAIAVTIAVA